MGGFEVEKFIFATPKHPLFSILGYGVIHPLIRGMAPSIQENFITYS